MQDYPLILDTTQSGIQQTVTGLYCGDAGEKRLSISLLHQSCIYTPQVGTLALCGKKADGKRHEKRSAPFPEGKTGSRHEVQGQFSARRACPRF